MRIKRRKAEKKPYEQRSDVEKLESNWAKAIGLLNRSEYSMAIVRAATCTEIAANIVIRAELVRKRHLEKDFVDKLLIWANGLQGKFCRLILPIFIGTQQHEQFKRLKGRATELNDARNEIAHCGHFASSKKARKLVGIAHQLCMHLGEPYAPKLKLMKPESA